MPSVEPPTGALLSRARAGSSRTLSMWKVSLAARRLASSTSSTRRKAMEAAPCFDQTCCRNLQWWTPRLSCDRCRFQRRAILTDDPIYTRPLGSWTIS